MEASPFDDPDVKAAQNSYGNAYDKDAPQQIATMKRLPSTDNKTDDTNRLMSNQGGGTGSIAMNVTEPVNDNYNKQTSTQNDHQSAPPPPNWCIRVFYWLPIRWFAFGGGCLLIVLCIVELIQRPTFADFLISLYLVLFGVLIMIVEAPAFVLTRKLQLAIFFWFRLLSRTFGRAWFYIFVSIICFFENVAFSYFVGVWIFIVAIAMFIYSRLAALKYVRIFIFISSGSESTDLKQKFDAKFDELDLDRDGKIGSLELVKVALQAGRTLTNSERHAIQTFLDESCNGSISKEDWWMQFSSYNLKQKFL